MHLFIFLRVSFYPNLYNMRSETWILSQFYYHIYLRLCTRRSNAGTLIFLHFLYFYIFIRIYTRCLLLKHWSFHIFTLYLSQNLYKIPETLILLHFYIFTFRSQNLYMSWNIDPFIFLLLCLSQNLDKMSTIGTLTLSHLYFYVFLRICTRCQLEYWSLWHCLPVLLPAQLSWSISDLSAPRKSPAPSRLRHINCLMLIIMKRGRISKWNMVNTCFLANGSAYIFLSFLWFSPL